MPWHPLLGDENTLGAKPPSDASGSPRLAQTPPGSPSRTAAPQAAAQPDSLMGLPWEAEEDPPPAAVAPVHRRKRGAVGLLAHVLRAVAKALDD